MRDYSILFLERKALKSPKNQGFTGDLKLWIMWINLTKSDKIRG
jgi:hypothetical protein